MATDSQAATAPTKLTDLLDTLAEGTSGEEVSLGDLLHTLDTRTYGPLLLAPAMIAASPLGAVPGMSIVTGSLITLIAVQLLVGRRRPWLPQRLLDLSFDRSRLVATRKSFRPWLRWAERPVKARLTRLIEPPFEQIIAAACVLLSVLFYPAALLPFAVFLPAVAVMFFALALSARDGLLAILAAALTVATIALLITYWPF